MSNTEFLRKFQFTDYGQNGRECDLRLGRLTGERYDKREVGGVTLYRQSGQDITKPLAVLRFRCQLTKRFDREDESRCGLVWGCAIHARHLDQTTSSPWGKTHRVAGNNVQRHEIWLVQIRTRHGQRGGAPGVAVSGHFHRAGPHHQRGLKCCFGI